MSIHFRHSDHNADNKNPSWLIIGFIGISILGWLEKSFDPDSFIIMMMFFIILFLTSVSFTYFATNIVRRSIIIGSGVFGFFLLRYLQLREPFYVLLLVACLISLELYYQKR